jgi:hypothetical protein
VSGHARALILHAGRLVADAAPDDVFANLPGEVLQRIDTPLAWRVSRELARAGRATFPTTSWPRLLQQLDANQARDSERA